MKRIIVTAVLVFLCFLVQTGICPWISFGGIKPNLLIILTAAFGFMRGEKTGIWVGFACGFFVDLFTVYGGDMGGDVFGLYALLYMLIGYMNGKCHQMFYPEDIKLPLLMIVASDLSLNVICYMMSFLLRARLDISYYFLHIMLPEAVYTIMIAFLFYPLFLFINKKLEKAERGSTD